MAIDAFLQLAISNGDVILIVVLLAIPIAGISFAIGAGSRFDEIGKGGLSLEFESEAPKGITDSDASQSAEVQDEELRQLLEAKAYRQRNRGEKAIDVEAEMARLKAETEAHTASADDRQLREEVRQLVVARNARRERQGKPPLDVDAEVERQLRDLQNFGQ